MTWRPESDEMHEMINLSTTISSNLTHNNHGIRQKFKTSSGKTYGDFPFQEAAPLIFPTLMY